MAPERAGASPTVVMAHGYSAVKEMHLDQFAEVFAEAGIGAMVFDNRNFGASDGEPRQEIDPWHQIRDYRDAITTTDSWQWFTETARSRAPAWRNEVTLRSVEMFLEYEPGAHIAHISPTPLMMVVALGDHLTVADEALAAYERALEPKRLVMLPGGHFDAYVRDFAASSGAACQWFREHLLTTGSA